MRSRERTSTGGRVKDFPSHFEKREESKNRKSNNKKIHVMKLFHHSFTSVMSPLKLKVGLGVVGTLAAVALVGSSLVPHAQANGSRHNDDLWLAQLENLAQVAELDQLVADFHGALSYGGDITEMMSLWTEDSSLTVNGTENDGKAAIQSFFLSTGFFHNNWVSLAPEYKTQITVQGDMAELSFQCVATDLTVTPNVVKSVIQAHAIAVRHGGKWLFKSSNNTTPAPL
jgi:hypothetical protein